MLHIFNARHAKTNARSLQKFLERAGINLPYGKALDALAVLSGYENWNGLANALTEESINKRLHGVELDHLEDCKDLKYGNECALVAHTGFELRYDAEAEMTDYVRVVDPLGRELMYWSSDEWAQDPQLVMGAILGALVRGSPAERQGDGKSTFLPAIGQVPFKQVSNVIIDGQPFMVQWLYEEWLPYVGHPELPDYDLCVDAVVLHLSYLDDGLLFEEALTVGELNALAWTQDENYFLGPKGERFEFFVESRFKPARNSPPRVVV